MISLEQAIGNLQEDLALRLVQEELAAGRSVLEVVEQCRNGMCLVGERYARGEHFLGDLVFSAEIFREAMEVLLPLLENQEYPSGSGQIVFGTVEGDIHDIGKNLSIALLKCHRFEVVDLGVDVPPDRFVQALTETGASILCLSTLLSSCFESMRRTVRLVRLLDREKRIKILIGGIVNERVREYVDADAWASDIREGVALCKSWSELE